MTSIPLRSILLVALLGCGDDVPSQAGGGGGTGGDASTGGAPSGGGGGGGEAGQGGGGGCTELELSSFGFAGELYAFSGTIAPELGADAKDIFELRQRKAQGEWPSGQASLLPSFSHCDTCITLRVDVDADTGLPRQVFFQQTGWVDYGSTHSPGSAGTIADVTLVEVELEGDAATPVPDGACVHIQEASFTSAVPAAWTCAPEQWGTHDGCDCGCGDSDPDCSVQPDEPLVGCPNEDDRCSGSGVCVPAAFRCSSLLYQDGAYCDCGCGVVDPDCADATLASCDYCDLASSCAEDTLCDDPASPIDPNNNGVCLPAPM